MSVEDRPLKRRTVIKVSTRLLAELLQLPDDVYIIAIQPDLVRDSLDFLLQGDRFDEVPDCAFPPEVHGEMTIEHAEDGARLRVTWPELT